jgi:hypothetical protein
VNVNEEEERTAEEQEMYEAALAMLEVVDGEIAKAGES